MALPLYGFVYVLGNDSMPGLLKIGYTERSPHLRALELSKATGVPNDFYIYGYAETDEAKILEAALHRHFNEVRESGKEFFRVGFPEVWKVMMGTYDSLALTICSAGEEALEGRRQ